MTLARFGVVAAVAGGIAFAVHAHAFVRQRADCATWRRARATAAHGAPAFPLWPVPAMSESLQRAVERALGEPDLIVLWRARDLLARYPLLVSELVPALRDPTEVGLRDTADLVVDGREMPWYGHGMWVEDDLFRRAGRASWLLKQATGHSAGVVRVQTDPLLLDDLARDWERWLDRLDGGAVCRPF